MKYLFTPLAAFMLMACQPSITDFGTDLKKLGTSSDRLQNRNVSASGYIRTTVEESSTSELIKAGKLYDFWEAMLYESESAALTATEYDINEGVLLFLYGENINLANLDISICDKLFVRVVGKRGLKDRGRTAINVSEIRTVQPENLKTDTPFKSIDCLTVN